MCHSSGQFSLCKIALTEMPTTSQRHQHLRQRTKQSFPNRHLLKNNYLGITPFALSPSAEVLKRKASKTSSFFVTLLPHSRSDRADRRNGKLLAESRISPWDRSLPHNGPQHHPVPIPQVTHLHTDSTAGLGPLESLSSPAS